MKPLQIVLLVAAGALGGAVIMKMAQRPQVVAEPPATVAQTQPQTQPQPQPQAQEPAPAPAPTPAAEQAPAPPAAAEPVSHPSPFQSPKPAPKLVRPRHKTESAAMVVQAPPSLPAAAAPSTVPVPAPAPEAAKAAPEPESLPPARPEPENVTPPPPAPEPHRVTLNAGTLIPVRLVDGLSSERSMPGDTFVATLDKELVADGFVIAERGARVEGRVVSSDRGGKVKGVAALSVELTRLHTSDGQKVALQTDSFEKRSAETHRQDAEKVGAGAAIGAVIGAIAGGGKGAAVGAGVGGGAGAGGVLLTRGDPARLPSETRISFRLRAPVTLTERIRG